MKTVLNIYFVFILNTIAIYAQDTTTTVIHDSAGSFLSDENHWTVEIPIWIPGFRGDFAYGDISLRGEDGVNPGEPEQPIEPPFPGGGNIISRLFNSSEYLKFFFVCRVSYKRNKFIAQLDGFTGSVGQSVNFNLNNREVVRGSYSVFLTRLFVGYRFYEYKSPSMNSRFTIIGYGGLKIHWVKIFSDLNRIENKLDLDFVWAHPIIGVQGNYALNDWLFVLQGDLGGYLSATNYSYMIQFFIYYRISNLLSLRTGWTDWDINHKRTILREELVINVHLSGPNFGLSFYF